VTEDHKLQVGTAKKMIKRFYKYVTTSDEGV